MSNAFRPSPRKRPSGSNKPPLYAVPSRSFEGRQHTRPLPGRRLAAVPNRFPSQPVVPPVVRQIPVQRRMPFWLRGLLGLQKISLITVFALAAATLAVYGSTVYVQQRWGDGFHKLNKLQRSERQFVAAGEMLKNQIARQAEAPNSGMIPRTTDNTVFLPAAPVRQENPVPSVAPPSEPAIRKPLGY